MKAFKDIINQRNHVQLEINQAYDKITELQDRIIGLYDAIGKSEKVLAEYNDIIEKLLPFYGKKEGENESATTE